MQNRIANTALFFILLIWACVAQSQTHDDSTQASAIASEATASAKKTLDDQADKTATTDEIKKSDNKKDETKAQLKNETQSQTKTSPATQPTKILPSDVRVLIDVSGSMKKTDPQNLRKPAVDLIARLLPDKSRAGIWTFGNDVNMLMPFKPVDAAWRKQGAFKSNQINSVAMFTNIGKALDEVSFDKKSLSTDYKTHIVLLTDGVVDIGKDAVGNNKERQRILNDILPGLKAAGYIVHTIALSPDADMDLLKKLSVATDGVFTTAISADQLMSVFLKIFDQAVPAERVPLENNGFLVDASIKEFTALIFRKPGEDRSIIVSPEAKEYSATDPNDGVNWYRTDKYDLITVTTPKSGQWKIKTETAPQSRITVVSDLQLVVDPLKNNLHSNDSLAVTYSFQESGKTVVNKDFLGLIEANAIVAKNNTEENVSLPFTADTPPDDGFFHQTLNAFPNVGDYEIHIFVDGKTFKREFKHSVSVRDSLMILEKNSAVSEDGKLTYSYKISTDDKIVDVKKTQVKVNIKNSANNNLEKVLNLIDGNHWEFSFAPTQAGDYSIDIQATGEQFDGDKLDETLHADNFTYVEKKAVQAASSSAAAEPEEEIKPAEEKPQEESNDLLLYISIGVGNLLLLVAGFFAYKMIMGGKAKDELVEFEKTLSAASSLEKNGQKNAGKNPVKKTPEKTEIDLSDDDPAHIPINDDNSDLDKLFPLDNMDDPNNSDRK
ncbi:MAG: VWA domain-containing protein [Gammaproteobacteria bacterium]|nr:MAG: VWA domain-containing protein [Gammaproteobacteria bacterium]